MLRPNPIRTTLAGLLALAVPAITVAQSEQLAAPEHFRAVQNDYVSTKTSQAAAEIKIELSPDCADGVCQLPSASSRTELDSSARSSASPATLAGFEESNEVVADPLAQEIKPASTAIGDARTGPGIAQWTKDPILAGAVSLGIVLIGYLVFRMLMRAGGTAVAGRIPKEVIEVIGYAPLNSRQQLQILRFSTRLVLVAVSNGGAEAIAEITDPIEVEQVIEACRGNSWTLSDAVARLATRPSTGRSGPLRRSPRAVFEA